MHGVLFDLLPLVPPELNLPKARPPQKGPPKIRYLEFSTKSTVHHVANLVFNDFLVSNTLSIEIAESTGCLLLSRNSSINSVRIDCLPCYKRPFLYYN